MSKKKAHFPVSGASLSMTSPLACPDERCPSQLLTVSMKSWCILLDKGSQTQCNTYSHFNECHWPSSQTFRMRSLLFTYLPINIYFWSSLIQYYVFILDWISEQLYCRLERVMIIQAAVAHKVTNLSSGAIKHRHTQIHTHVRTHTLCATHSLSHSLRHPLIYTLVTSLKRVIILLTS